MDLLMQAVDAEEGGTRADRGAAQDPKSAVAGRLSSPRPRHLLSFTWRRKYPLPIILHYCNEFDICALAFVDTPPKRKEEQFLNGFGK